MQQPLDFMLPDVDFKLPKLGELPSWRGVKRLGIDTETRDPKLKEMGPGVRRDGRMVGVSFAFEDGPDFYLPFDHAGDNLPRDQVFAYLRDNAKHYDGIVCGSNLGYDLDYMAQQGIVFPNAKGYRDTQVAEPLIDETQFRFGLNATAIKYDLPQKDEAVLRAAARAYDVNPKLGLWGLPARFADAYARYDARLPLLVLRRQERIIDEEDLWGIYDLENRLIPIMVEMRRIGIRVDLDKVEQIRKWSIEQELEACKEIDRLTGIRIGLDEITQGALIVRALQAIGVKLTVRNKDKKDGTPGEFSVANEVLDLIDDPVISQIQRAKKFNKLRGTFVSSVLSHQVNGRLHCTFNQLKREKEDGDTAGTIARLSCCDLNLQQQPSRDPEIAPRWRSIYIPEDGGIWACLDYSQQEPRMAVHFAEIMNLPKSQEAGDKYRDDPTTDNHTMMAQLMYGLGDGKPSKKQRSEAKIVFLGLCYSMGGASLCRKLGLPTQWKEIKGRWRECAGPEGQTIIDRFNDEVPFVRKLAWKAEKAGARRGYVKTILGRRCRFMRKPNDEPGYMDTRKALNKIIQGSSADQTKKAIVDAWDAGHRVPLQVHDELDFTAESPSHAEEVAQIMRTCVPLSVPSKVDVELGPSWGEIVDISKYQETYG